MKKKTDRLFRIFTVWTTFVEMWLSSERNTHTHDTKRSIEHLEKKNPVCYSVRVWLNNSASDQFRKIVCHLNIASCIYITRYAQAHAHKRTHILAFVFFFQKKSEMEWSKNLPSHQACFEPKSTNTPQTQRSVWYLTQLVTTICSFHFLYVWHYTFLSVT